MYGFAIWGYPLVSWNLGSVTTSRHWVGFILILPLVQTIRNHHRYRSWHRVGWAVLYCWLIGSWYSRWPRRRGRRPPRTRCSPACPSSAGPVWSWPRTRPASSSPAAAPPRTPARSCSAWHRGQGLSKYWTGHLNFWTMAPLHTLLPWYLQSPLSCHILWLVLDLIRCLLTILTFLLTLFEKLFFLWPIPSHTRAMTKN